MRFPFFKISTYPNPETDRSTGFFSFPLSTKWLAKGTILIHWIQPHTTIIHWKPNAPFSGQYTWFHHQTHKSNYLIKHINQTILPSVRNETYLETRWLEQGFLFIYIELRHQQYENWIVLTINKNFSTAKKRKQKGMDTCSLRFQYESLKDSLPWKTFNPWHHFFSR